MTTQTTVLFQPLDRDKSYVRILTEIEAQRDGFVVEIIDVNSYRCEFIDPDKISADTAMIINKAWKNTNACADGGITSAGKTIHAFSIFLFRLMKSLNTTKTLCDVVLTQ